MIILSKPLLFLKKLKVGKDAGIFKKVFLNKFGS